MTLLNDAFLDATRKSFALTNDRRDDRREGPAKMAESMVCEWQIPTPIERWAIDSSRSVTDPLSRAARPGDETGSRPSG